MTASESRVRRTGHRVAVTGSCALLLALVAPAHHAAAASRRLAVTQRGDFAVIGNSLGWDCGAGIPPALLGTVGPCGSNTTDTAADLYWRAADDGTADAELSVTPAQARSAAVLALPADAVVTHAWLYWSASLGAAGIDDHVTLDRAGVGAFSAAIVADSTVQATGAGGFYFQSRADVSALVLQHGAGTYRISDVDGMVLANLDSDVAYAAWALVVLYRQPGAPLRSFTIFDGLDPISTNTPQVSLSIDGFLSPSVSPGGRVAVLGYEGDDTVTGDAVSWNGQPLTDAANPGNNFFNGTRSVAGVASSAAGDSPRLAGGPRSIAGLDVDVVDVSDRLMPGQSIATVTASTSQDFYLLGAVVSAMTTTRPDFADLVQTVRVLQSHTDGAILPGDTLEYTISGSNSGNDSARGMTLDDRLPPGVSYLPGSLMVIAGPLAGAKTDVAGDDQAEYLPMQRLVRFRLGTGATATAGGALALGANFVLTYRVTVDASTSGAVANQGILVAAATTGGSPFETPTDGNGPDLGVPPTTVTVDQCLRDADCSLVTPYCLTKTAPRICVGCLENANCGGGNNKCDPQTFTCRGCTGNAECTGATPICDLSRGTCVACLADVQCPRSAPVCRLDTNACVGCASDTQCRGVAPVCDTGQMSCRACSKASECGLATPLCLPSGACGKCSATDRTRCAGTTKVCDTVLGLCVGCVSGGDCSGATPICDATAKSCRGCMSDRDCGEEAPVCTSSGACARGDAGAVGHVDNPDGGGGGTRISGSGCQIAGQGAPGAAGELLAAAGLLSLLERRRRRARRPSPLRAPS